jgi:putative spermidine/putrescine transport system permease protein
MNMARLLGRVAGGLVLFVGLLLMLAPIVTVVLVSFSATPVFDLPTEGVSLRWYASLSQREGLWPSISLSLQIAAISTLASVLLGTLCAIGLIRGHFPGRDAVLAIVLSPMMLPGVVIGIAMLFAFRGAGLYNSFASLVLGHVVITLPYVVRIIYANLSLFDFRLIEAARTLGLAPARAVTKVMIPILAPAFLTSGIFAFIASLDNYSLALFLGDVDHVTLPVRILSYIEYSTDPSLAAISTLMVCVTAVFLFIGARLVGVRGLAGK